MSSIEVEYTTTFEATKQVKLLSLKVLVVGHFHSKFVFNYVEVIRKL
jgi:hypothetical protein